MADEHRLRARADRLRRFDDPTQSHDPRVVAVLERLNDVATQHASVVAPAAFRAELRAQLVAITPRLVAEHAPANTGRTITTERPAVAAAVADRPRPSPRPRVEQPATSEPRAPRRSLRDVLGSIPLARPLAVVASLVTVLALVLGGAVYLSRDAVPGDTLYGLKRAGERFELSLTDNDTERAGKYLEFASTRVVEARELVSRASASAAGRGPLADGALSPQTAALVTDALNSADGDTQTASRLLGGVAVESASPAPLTKLTDWAPSQLSRLEALRAAVPSGTPVKAAATQSATLLQAAKARAAALQQKVDCNCLKNAPTDAYGPLPIPAPATTSNGGSAGSGRTGGSTTSAGTPARPGSARSQTSAPSTPAGKTGQTTTPRIKLPLPTLLPNPPKPTSSKTGLLCKVDLLGLRLCPSPDN